MAIIISLLMSLGIFSDNVHATYQSIDAPDGKTQHEATNARGWDWDSNG